MGSHECAPPIGSGGVPRMLLHGVIDHSLDRHGRKDAARCVPPESPDGNPCHSARHDALPAATHETSGWARTPDRPVNRPVISIGHLSYLFTMERSCRCQFMLAPVCQAAQDSRTCSHCFLGVGASRPQWLVRASRPFSCVTPFTLSVNSYGLAPRCS